jgi:hypothetical protein
MTRAPEITIRTYKEPDGELVRQFSVNGAVFRYDVAPKGKPPYEYRLIDKDGDGNFETKEQLVGETEAGGKKERYYIDLGPQPGTEKKYSYEQEEPYRPGETSNLEKEQLMSGYPIYIPQWVILRFDIK